LELNVIGAQRYWSSTLLGFLFKWGRTNDLKRRTGEHIKTYGNLISSTLQLKYFSPVDNVYEVDVESEIRGHFQGNAIQFRNHKELIILDKNQLPGARAFYEDRNLVQKWISCWV
jgi:hypothetical protein